MAYKVVDIANKIVSMADPEIGETISNLKLQKLLYYTQGFALAFFGKPLFKEKIVAWQYGPVVTEAYHNFSKFKNGAITLAEDVQTIYLSETEEDLLRQVYSAYGQFSALKLMDMTHEEMPWKSTPINQEITEDKLKVFFKQLVE